MGQQDILETRNTTIRAEIKALIDAADSENRGITDEEQGTIDGLHAEVRSNLTKIDSIRATVAEQAEFEARTKAIVPAPPTPAVVIPTVGPITTELRTEPYRPGGEHSWFLDRYEADKGNREARERLDVAYRYRIAHPELERRVGATTVAGFGGEAAPPAWYENQLVNLLRPGRVFADALNKQPLPPNVSSINLPKVSTGTAVGTQATQNTTIVQQDITTSSVNTGITTVAGGALVSLQLLQQSPISIDQVLLHDLAKALATQIDVAAITAVAGVAGVNAVTYTDASPTSIKVTQQIQQGIDLVNVGVYETPTAIIMRPERWGKMIAASDASGRPFVLPSSEYGRNNNVGAANGQTAQGPAGTMRGLPVWIDPNIPTNVGAANQDEIFVLAADEIYLYESSVFFGTFEQTFANTLSLYIRAHEFLGVIPNRYPKAISIISGSGMSTTLGYGS